MGRRSESGKGQQVRGFAVGPRNNHWFTTDLQNARRRTSESDVAPRSCSFMFHVCLQRFNPEPLHPGYMGYIASASPLEAQERESVATSARACVSQSVPKLNSRLSSLQS